MPVCPGSSGCCGGKSWELFDATSLAPTVVASANSTTLCKVDTHALTRQPNPTSSPLSPATVATGVLLSGFLFNVSSPVSALEVTIDEASTLQGGVPQWWTSRRFFVPANAGQAFSFRHIAFGRLVRIIITNVGANSIALHGNVFARVPDVTDQVGIGDSWDNTWSWQQTGVVSIGAAATSDIIHVDKTWNTVVGGTGSGSDNIATVHSRAWDCTLNVATASAGAVVQLLGGQAVNAVTTVLATSAVVAAAALYNLQTLFTVAGGRMYPSMPFFRIKFTNGGTQQAAGFYMNLMAGGRTA